MNGKTIYLRSFVLSFTLLGSICWGLENQIINGEFDAGLEFWQRSVGDGYTIEVVQGADLSGTNALKIDVLDATAQESIMIFQGSFTLEPGAKCHIGFTAKADADRQIGLLLEYNNVWAYTWHEWIDLITLPKTFNFEFINYHSSTDNIVIYFILKHPWFPLINEDDNIDVFIDEVYVIQEPPADPNLAHYPWPPDGAMHPETWIICSWTPGQYASTHDVYISENFDDVLNCTEDTYRGNYRDTFFIYGFLDYPHSPGLIPGNTYYWRINEVNDLHPDSPWKGDVWSFWLPPYTASRPIPADGAELIDPNIALSWTAGFGAKSHTLYMGEHSTDVEAGTGGTFKGNFSQATYLPDCLDFDKTYYWRVDEFGWSGTHKGEIWSFSTKPAKPNIAHDPSPPDGAMHPDTWVILTWSPGRHAVSHDFYFGYNFDDVNNGTGETYYWNQNSLYVVAGFPGFPWEGLIPGSTIYWRVDEVNDLHPDSPWKGDVWSFTAAETETVVYQVSSSEDDGYAFNRTSQNLQTEYLKVGYSGFAPPPYYMSGMVFRNVNIPPGTVIVSAHLKVQSYDNHLTGTVYGRVEAEATEDAVAFNSSRHIDSLLTTSASVDWIIKEPWSADTWYESPDISSIIQEIIDRAGWSAGNSLAILCSTSSEGSYRNFSSYDRGSDYAPILQIKYQSRKERP